METDEQTMTTDQAVEAIRAASFEAPKAHSYTEWAARIRSVLAAHARNFLPGAGAPPGIEAPCDRTFEVLGQGAVRVHYSCGVDIEFANLPPWPANHDVFAARLADPAHPHTSLAQSTPEAHCPHCWATDAVPLSSGLSCTNAWHHEATRRARMPPAGGFGMFSEAGETLIERLVEALLSGIGAGTTAEQIARAVEHIQDAASDLGYNEAHDTEVRWAIFRRLASAAVPYEALRAEWLRAGAAS